MEKKSCTSVTVKLLIEPQKAIFEDDFLDTCSQELLLLAENNTRGVRTEGPLHMRIAREHHTKNRTQPNRCICSRNDKSNRTIYVMASGVKGLIAKLDAAKLKEEADRAAKQLQEYETLKRDSAAAAERQRRQKVRVLVITSST